MKCDHVAVIRVFIDSKTNLLIFIHNFYIHIYHIVTREFEGFGGVALRIPEKSWSVL